MSMTWYGVFCISSLHTFPYYSSPGLTRMRLGIHPHPTDEANIRNIDGREWFRCLERLKPESLHDSGNRNGSGPSFQRSNCVSDLILNASTPRSFNRFN